VWDGGNGETHPTSSTLDISHFAERHGLSFIFGEAARVGIKLPVLINDLLQPEAQMSTTLKAKLEDERPWLASNWGINE
jgi:hypothetical protein